MEVRDHDHRPAGLGDDDLTRHGARAPPGVRRRHLDGEHHPGPRVGWQVQGDLPPDRTGPGAHRRRARHPVTGDDQLDGSVRPTPLEGDVQDLVRGALGAHEALRGRDEDERGRDRGRRRQPEPRGA